MPLFLIITCLLLVLPAQASEPPQVTVSIRPLQLMADEILSGVGRARLLIDADQSPHHFQLRPSQLRLAAHSDLLLWISDDFETGLARIRGALPAQASVLQLVNELPPEQLIGDEHDLDGHIWLSPQNLVSISELLVRHLSAIDPQHQAVYHRNGLAQQERLQQWRRRYKQQFAAFMPSYLQEHRFLSYFEHDLELAVSDSLRNTHDHGSRLRSLSDLQQRLQQNPPACLLVSRLPPSSQAKQLAKRFGLEIRLIRTLGTAQDRDIIELLDRIAGTLDACHR